MGIRGEIFSTKVALQNRTYFFNVKENRNGDLYLNIVESKNRETGGFERQSVILFADDLREFITGFDESLRVLEKASREKRKGDKSSRSPRTDTADNPAEGSKPRMGRRDSEKSFKPRPQGDRPPRERSGGRGSEDQAYKKPRRRVVRRKD